MGVFYTFYLKLKKRHSEDELIVKDSELPHLHKEYKRQHNTGPIYVDVVSSDSVTLHDSTTPPRGFSTDHIVVPSSPSQKPNQQPSFSEQFHNGSSQSIQLSPLRTPVTPTFNNITPVVKPSI